MTRTPPTVIGRYAIFDRIAAGGMASVHIGRLLGSAFSRTVAIKRLHPQFALDPEFVAMFLDEARICARIRHPNVVPTLDVFDRDGELFLVMEYVEGESVAQLLRASRVNGQVPPPSVVASIGSGMLHGLHAAHEARSDTGEPLGIVHRDMSPQNVLVGTDGSARVLDFGVAKALGRLHTTREGSVKGKFAYMAPEQIQGNDVTRRTDIFAAATVLWEMLTTERLFHAENEARRMHMILHEPVRSPSELAPDISPELDRVVMRGLKRKSSDRYASALEMAEALERAIPLATPRVVGVWVGSLLATELASRAVRVAEAESFSSTTPQAALQSQAARDDDVTVADPTLLDPASRTQASSISVSKSSVPNDQERNSTRMRGRTRLVAAAAVVLTGTLVVRFLLPGAAVSSGGVAATSASAIPMASEPSVPVSNEPPPVTQPVAMSAPDAAASADPSPRSPAKRPPRPKKAVYTRE
jgi:eukaryotic-like serine/threonine-protein kinase